VTIKAGFEADALSFQTDDVVFLNLMLKECKRLKELADAPPTNAQALQTYSWLAPYAQKDRYPHASSSLHADLRTSRIPLHDRLSPASAGSPGNNLSDIITIRDDWILSHARHAASKGKNKLRLRLGTFNVNDQFPSQDLSPWLGSAGETSRVRIPPLKSAAPLSLGMKHLSLDTASTSIVSQDDEDTSNLTGDQHDEDDKGGSKAHPVTHVDDDIDPDLFVLGFQELDLSTEALIYSTTTAKADAWCTAVFAALGEKAVLYEKVTLFVKHNPSTVVIPLTICFRSWDRNSW
jgi:phosphatidylinositol-bisphosphatase